jgi:hypothetical protein
MICRLEIKIESCNSRDCDNKICTVRLRVNKNKLGAGNE